MPTLALWNWHTPYARLLALSLPDWELLVLPTTHAPSGWRADQRPRPVNVRVLSAPGAVVDARPDVCLSQTYGDAAVFLTQVPARGYVLLLHNHAACEPPTLLHYLHVIGGAPNGRVVAISPMKAASWRQAGYDGPLEVILPGIPESDFGSWTGDDPVVLTVANNLRRPLFDLAAWEEATQGLPVRLVGEGNAGIPGAVGPAPSWEALRSEYQRARVYLSVCRSPYEDGYNLALLEAMATGVPCVCLDTPTVPTGVDRATTPERLAHFLRIYLGATGAPFHEWRGRIQAQVRAQFPFDRFAAYWRQVLEEVAGG